MTQYRVTWTENICWETYVEAENEEHAKDKAIDEGQETANQYKSLSDWDNVEVQEYDK